METKTFEAWIDHGKWGTVFTYNNWYAVRGSNEIKRACCKAELYDGVNLNTVMDNDSRLAPVSIENEKDLIMAVISL